MDQYEVTVGESLVFETAAGRVEVCISLATPKQVWVLVGAPRSVVVMRGELLADRGKGKRK